MAIKNHSLYKDNLNSERLTTRLLTSNDVAIWTNFFNDKDCARFFPTMGMTNATDRAAFWIQKQLARYEENRFGLQALINKETGEFVGQCGLLLQEVDSQPVLEIGYSLLKPHWHKGYAIEAAQLFKDYAFHSDFSDELVSIIDTQNVTSQAVAIKNGMLNLKQTRFWDLDVFIFGIDKKSYLQHKAH
jgi:RimJ/RimL family protein N-acetyltransferase